MSDPLTLLEEEIIDCRKCPRLVAWREEIAQTKRKAYKDQDYWGKPVPGFGDHHAKILVVGLAPGAHGSNRTGRMFTGDASGDILYRNLHKFGFANQPQSIQMGDGLKLTSIYISAVCRCVPPGNKPAPREISNCLPYLLREMEFLKELNGLVALGRIAYDGIAQIFSKQGYFLPKNEFGHGKLIPITGSQLWVLQSYHPSRQNTQTGRLTEKMFADIWAKARELTSI